MILRAAVVVSAMLFAVAASWALTPRIDQAKPGDVTLASIVPREFGEWREVTSLFAQVDVAVRRDENPEASRLYDEVLTRTYRSSTGELVMLSVAYGRRQRQEVKIHRPELCYAAQGFEVTDSRARTLSLLESTIPTRTFVAVRGDRSEVVNYWIRIGNVNAVSAVESRAHIVRAGLAGLVPDGVLVRTSQILEPTQTSTESILLQDAFVRALLEAMPASHANRMASSVRGNADTESP